MSKGPKNITIGGVDELAAKAENFIAEKQAVTTYSQLAPIFEKFTDAGLGATDCFNFLVSEGILSQRQKQSFQNSFSAWKKNLT